MNKNNNFNNLFQKKIVQELKKWELLDKYKSITPEEEFWAISSNLQAWFENDYNLELISRNLGIGLLKKLIEIGDLKAKDVFKEEVIKLLSIGQFQNLMFLLNEDFISRFRKDELDALFEKIDIKNILRKDLIERINILTNLAYIGVKQAQKILKQELNDGSFKTFIQGLLSSGNYRDLLFILNKKFISQLNKEETNVFFESFTGEYLKKMSFQIRPSILVKLVELGSPYAKNAILEELSKLINNKSGSIDQEAIFETGYLNYLNKEDLETIGLKIEYVEYKNRKIPVFNGFLNLGAHLINSLSDVQGMDKLSSLINLDLMGNGLNTLPEFFSDIKSLKVLRLDYNKLRNLPDSFCNLSSLQDLNLCHNLLMALPESFGNLSSLIILDLRENILNSLPDSFGELNSLKILRLDGCKLKKIPRSFGNLSMLQELTLKDNELTSLPKSFGNLSTLRKLSLLNSGLKSLPETIGNLKSLEFLHLGRNKLSSLPDSMENLLSLEILSLSGNQFSIFPELITKLKNLKSLSIDNNQITSLPNSIDKLSFLEELHLQGNNLINLPSSIGNLKSLEILSLRGNVLNTIPESIGNLKSLKKLYLNNNQLVTIPNTVINLESLQEFSVLENPLDPKTYSSLVKLSKKNITFF